MYNFNKNLLEKIKKEDQNLLLFDLETTGLKNPVEISEIGYIVLTLKYNKKENTIDMVEIAEGCEYFNVSKEIEPGAVLITNIIRSIDLSNKNYMNDLNVVAKEMFKTVNVSKYHKLDEESTFTKKYFDNIIEKYNITLFAGHNLYEYDFFKVLTTTYNVGISPENVFDTLYYLIHSERYKLTRGQNLNKLAKEIAKKIKDPELDKMIDERDEYHDALIDVKVNKFVLSQQLNELIVSEVGQIENSFDNTNDLEEFKSGDYIYARTEVSGDSILTMNSLIEKCKELECKKLIIVDNTFTGTIKNSSKKSNDLEIIFGIKVTNIDDNSEYDILLKNTLEYRKILPLLIEQNQVTTDSLEDIKKYTNNLVIPSQPVPLYLMKDDSIIHFIHMKSKDNRAFTKQELDGFLDFNKENLSIENGNVKSKEINTLLKNTITIENGWEAVDFQFYKHLGLSSFPSLPVLYSGRNGEITTEPDTLDEFLTILRELVYSEFDLRNLKQSIKISYSIEDEEELNKLVDDYHSRIEEELAVLKALGNPDYVKYFFLVKKIGEFIKFGPGRGSGAGSILLWILGVTDTDPIKYGLLFERFMDPERPDFPDVDLDIASKSYAFNALSDYFNEAVKNTMDYTKKPFDIYDNTIIEKYIKPNNIFVGKITTVSKSSRLTVANSFVRLNGFPESMKKSLSREFNDKSTILSNIELCSESNMFFEKYPLDSIPEEHVLFNRMKQYNNLLEKLDNLQDLTTNYGLHAGGVIFFPYHSCCIAPMHQENAICYDKDDTESMNMIKMDLLGLKTHAILQELQNFISSSYEDNKVFNLNFQKFDDPKVFKALSEKFTAETFQMGSAGMDNIVESLSPLVFEDMIATTALYRPGPLGSGAVDDYICSAQEEKVKKYDIKDTISLITKREEEFNIYDKLILEQKEIVNTFKRNIRKLNELLIEIRDWKKFNKDPDGKSKEVPENLNGLLDMTNLKIANTFLKYQKITGYLNDISIQQKDNLYGKFTDADGETFYPSKIISEIVQSACVKTRVKFTVPKELKTDFQYLQSFYLIDDPVVNERTIYDNEDNDIEYFENFVKNLQDFGLKKEIGDINQNFIQKSRFAYEEVEVDNELSLLNTKSINNINIDNLSYTLFSKVSKFLKGNTFLFAKNDLIKKMSKDFDSSLIINQVVVNLLNPAVFYEDEKFKQPLYAFYNAYQDLKENIDEELLKKIVDVDLTKNDLSDEELEELEIICEQSNCSFNKTYTEIIYNYNLYSPEEFIHKIKEYDLIIKDKERYFELTSETYGVMVYQEQIMKISVQMAGYTKADSNQLRKAIAKQKKEAMIVHSNKFVNGISSKQINKMEFTGKYSHLVCYKTLESELLIVNTNDNTEHNIIATIEPDTSIRPLNACLKEDLPLIEELNKEENRKNLQVTYNEAELTFLQAKYLWAKIEAFGAYAFNKSHSASYSILTYLTQYYKEHYMMEAYTYFLRHVSEKNKMELVREIHRRGIEFKLQPLNSSVSLDFTFEDKTIFVPLTFIKSLGNKEILSIMSYFQEYDINTIEEYIVLTGSKPKKKILEVLGTLGVLDFNNNKNKPFCNITQREWYTLHELDLNKKSIFIDYIFKESIKVKEYKDKLKDFEQKIEQNSFSRVIFEPKYFELLHNLYFYQKRLSVEMDMEEISKNLYLNEDLLSLESDLIKALISDLTKAKPTIFEEDISFLLIHIPLFEESIIETINDITKLSNEEKEKYIKLFIEKNGNGIQRNYLFFKEDKTYIEMKKQYTEKSLVCGKVLRNNNIRLVEGIKIDTLTKDINIIENSTVIENLIHVLEQKVKYNKLTIPFIDKLRLLFEKVQKLQKEGKLEVEEISWFKKYTKIIVPLVSRNGLFDSIYIDSETITNSKESLEDLKEILLLISTNNFKIIETKSKVTTLLTSLTKLYDFVEKLKEVPFENVIDTLTLETEVEDKLNLDEMSLIYESYLKEGANIFTIKTESLTELNKVSYIDSKKILDTYLSENYTDTFNTTLSIISAIKSIKEEDDLKLTITDLLNNEKNDSITKSSNKDMFIDNSFDNNLFNYVLYPDLKQYIPETLPQDLQANIIANNLNPRHGNSSIYNFLILTETKTDNKNLSSYISELFFDIPEEEKENFLPLYLTTSILSKKEKEKLVKYLPESMFIEYEKLTNKIIMDSLYDITSQEDLNKILISVTGLKSELRKQILMKTYKFVEPGFGETGILPIVNSKKKVKKIECSFVKWFPWSFMEEPYYNSKQSFVDCLYSKDSIFIRKNLN